MRVMSRDEGIPARFRQTPSGGAWCAAGLGFREIPELVMGARIAESEGDVEYRGYFVRLERVGEHLGEDTWTWCTFSPDGELAYTSSWAYERREDALVEAFAEVDDALDGTHSYIAMV